MTDFAPLEENTAEEPHLEDTHHAIPGSAEFDWARYFLELFYHLFFPFSYPIIRWLEGPFGVCNRDMCMGFFSSTCRGRVNIYDQMSIYLCVLFPNICLLAGKLNFEVVSGSEITFMNLLFFSWASVVSTKYAWYHPDDVQSLRQTLWDNPKRAIYFVFSAWAEPTVETVDRELSRAYLNLGVDLRNTFLQVDRSLPGACIAVTDIEQHLLQFGWTETQLTIKESNSSPPTETNNALHNLSKLPSNPKPLFKTNSLNTTTSATNSANNSDEEADQSKFTTICAHDLARFAVSKPINKGASARFRRIVNTICICIAIMPTILRLCLDLPTAWQSSVFDIFVWFSLFYSTFCLSIRNLVFLLVCLVDFRRLWLSLEVVGGLLSSSCVLKRQSCTLTVWPVVDVTRQECVFAWLQVRYAAKNFGTWYRHRLQSYMASCCVLVVVMVILLFSALAQNSSSSPNEDDVGGRETLMWGLMVSVMVVLSLLAVIGSVMYGENSNALTGLHMYLILKSQSVVLDFMHNLRLKMSKTVTATNSNVALLMTQNKPTLGRTNKKSAFTHIVADFDGRPGSQLSSDELELWFPLPLKATFLSSTDFDLAVKCILWAREQAIEKSDPGESIILSDFGNQCDDPRDRDELNRFVYKIVFDSFQKGQKSYKAARAEKLQQTLKQMQETCELLTQAASNVEHDNNVNPVTFMGFVASHALTNVVLTMVVTTLTALLNLFFGLDL